MSDKKKTIKKTSNHPLASGLSRAEQLSLDLYLAERCYALYWAQTKFKWTPKGFYQKLLLGCLDRVYRYPMDHPEKKLRGEVVNRFAWRIGRQCQKAGTIIHTEDGQLMPIEEHPEAFRTQKNATIYNIRTRGGQTVQCTGNHPISKLDEGFINADMLKVGDKIETLVEFNKFGNGIINYDYKIKNGKEKLSGTLKMNEELAEFVGWMTTDGSVRSFLFGSRKTSLVFTNTNLNYINRVKYIVEKYFKNTNIIESRVEAHNNEKLRYILAFTSKKRGNHKNEVFNFFRQLDYHPSGFPRAVAKYFTREQVCAFLRGSYGGDGNFYIKNHSTTVSLACNKDRTYAEYYREILNKLGISAKIKTCYGKNRKKERCEEPYYNVCFFSKHDLKTFINKIGQILDKSVIISNSYKVPNRIRNPITKTYSDGEVTTFSEIVEISILEKKYDCWDVEFPAKGWYITGGVRVSNSGKTEILGLGALYLGICKPVKFNRTYAVQKESAKSASNPNGTVMVKEEFVRGAKIIMASADADKAKTVFNRVMSFLNMCPEYQAAMDSGIITIKKNPFPMIEISADGWTENATIVFRGPGASGQAARSHTYDYKLYDEADYMPSSFFEAELATEINAKTKEGKDNSFVILSSTPSGKREHFFKACFAEEALVTMADGSMKQIKSIEVGDFVKNRFGKDEEVTATMSRAYKGKISRLAIPGFDSIRVTPNHKIMAVKKFNVYCKSCCANIWGRNIKCPLYGNHKTKAIKPEYMKAETVGIGDFVAVPKAIADIHFKNNSYLNTKTNKREPLKNYYKNRSFLFLPILQYDELKNQNIRVYNLTVGEDHSYTVNGFGVANCNDPKMGFKEFHFPSWENPNYDEKMDRKSQATLTKTAYDHEIMADWGTVEMGVFDWTYFGKVFSYKYKNNKNENTFEYRQIKLNPDDIRAIGMNNLISWLMQRFTPKYPQCKYWFGADLGYTADPSEFVVFEEFNGVMKLVLRVHMEHLTYDIQADIVALMDRHYMFNMLGMDAGNNGTALAQILQSTRTGWNKFASHNFSKRLVPIPFGGRLQIDKINGKEITEPAKAAMTNMIIAHAEQNLLIMPGLDYDTEIETQFRNHTYSIGLNGQIVYSKGTISADHCLTPDTPITTLEGIKPIEKVTTSDFVLTRNGFKKVLFSGKTFENISTLHVHLSNGTIIKGTGNHPVFVKNKNEFVRMDELSPGDELFHIEELQQTWQQQQATKNQKYLSSTTLHIEDIQMHHAQQIKNISNLRLLNPDKPNYSIEPYGNIITDPSLKATTYTTKTATLQTMPWTILNASAAKSIKKNIKKNNPNEALLNDNSNILKTLDHSQKNGTNQKKVTNGILSMEKMHSKVDNQENTFAINAQLNLNHSHSLKLDSVPPFAKEDGAQLIAQMEYTKFANGVNKNSSINTTQNQLAPVRVVQVLNGPKSNVYDLTVEDTHEFFAHEVLVHNCIDACRTAFYVKRASQFTVKKRLPGPSMFKQNRHW